MRFQYLPPRSQQMVQRMRLESQFEQFWSRFRDRVDELETALRSNGQVAELLHEMLPLLKGSQPDSLEWEIGPNPDGRWHLAICTAGRRALRAMCDRLIELAPTIPEWSFSAHRQPTPATVAPKLLEGRRCRPLPEAVFRVETHPFGVIGLECFTAVDEEPDDALRGSALILAEILIGEEDFDRWIGPIDLIPRRKQGLFRRRAAPPPDAVPMDQIRNRVLAEIARLRSRLPEKPRFELDEQGWADAGAIGGERKILGVDEQANWSIAEVKPKSPDAEGDWAGTEDQFVAVIRDCRLLNATRAPGFDSLRHSRFGERFCYVKAELEGFIASVDERIALEEAIDQALRQAKAGCTWGGGTGMRYAYVELALVDVEAGIRVLRETIGQPSRAWLLFHDADFVDEYVDLVGDDQPPPRREAQS